MAQYDYKTSSGTKVSLTINSLENITAIANDTGFVCYAQKGFSYNPKNRLPALTTDLKIQGQTVNLEITEEIKVYINELKEEDKISKLPLKEQLKTRIQKLKAETNFTYFVDADLVTGKKYFTLTKKHDKNVWSKIAKYFTYINTSHHSDDFDAMYGSNFKGWLTDNPNEVDAILKDLLKIDNTAQIAELEQELDKLLIKEEYIIGEATTYDVDGNLTENLQRKKYLIEEYSKAQTYMTLEEIQAYIKELFGAKYSLETIKKNLDGKEIGIKEIYLKIKGGGIIWTH